MFTGGKRKLDRAEGAIFVLLYIGYIVFSCVARVDLRSNIKIFCEESQIMSQTN